MKHYKTLCWISGWDKKTRQKPRRWYFSENLWIFLSSMFFFKVKSHFVFFQRKLDIIIEWKLCTIFFNVILITNDPSAHTDCVTRMKTLWKTLCVASFFIKAIKKPFCTTKLVACEIFKRRQREIFTRWELNRKRVSIVFKQSST